MSELALKYLLTQKGSGNAVVIMVGGGAEALLCHPGATTVLLKQRKGFVKVALETEEDLVNQIRNVRVRGFLTDDILF